MNFSYSEKVVKLQERVINFMEEHVYPNEKYYKEQLNQQKTRWSDVPPIMEELKKRRKQKDYGTCFCRKVNMVPV